MSKQNSERYDFDLEASNAFTLKGEEETQIEQSTRIEIETNKRHQKASNSHSSIVINNLTNYSFGFSEHKLNSEENDINNESKNDIIGSFQRNKNNITQKRKCDSVVKIKLTKMKKSKTVVNTPRIETPNFKKVNKEVNLCDKEIENLNESSSVNKDEGSEENKMELELIENKEENKENEFKKEEEKESNMDESIHEDFVHFGSENLEFDRKIKEYLNNNDEIQKENKDKDISNDMIIEPEKTDIFTQEIKEKNEIITEQKNENNIINEISKMNLENDSKKEEKNKDIIIEINEKEYKENLDNIIKEKAGRNKEENKERKKEKEKKSKSKARGSKIEENKRMKLEDVNRIDKVKEVKKDKEDDKQKIEEEVQVSIQSPFVEESNNEINKEENNNNENKIEEEKGEKMKEEKEEKEKEKEKEGKVEKEENEKKVEKEEKIEKEEIKDHNDMTNQLEEQKINDNKEKDNTKMEEEKEKTINESNEIKNEKEKEGKVSKTENINNNIFGNMNNNFFLDYIAIIKQQIKNELCQEMLKKGTDNIPEPFNPKENKNLSNDPNDNNNTKNFLGKKRLKSPPEDLINKENNEEIKINQEKNVINNNTIENKGKENEKEKEQKIIKNEINSEKSSSIYDFLEKHIFDYLYEKVNKESLSNNNELEKQLKMLIADKGYSNVKSALNNIKKEKDKKENEMNSIKDKKEPSEYHYQFENNFCHRFKLLKISEGIQIYVCCDQKCQAHAKLNVKERKFNIIQKHTVLLKEHISFNDDRPAYFMKTRKLDEVHIKRNDHNDKYHLEWFK